MKARVGGWAVVGSVALPALLTLAACGGAASDGRPTPPTDELVIVTPMPVTPTAAAGAVSEQTYVVQKGDTLSGIAARFAVSEGVLQGANSLADPDRLVAGQRLVVPIPTP